MDTTGSSAAASTPAAAVALTATSFLLRRQRAEWRRPVAASYKYESKDDGARVVEVPVAIAHSTLIISLFTLTTAVLLSLFFFLRRVPLYQLVCSFFRRMFSGLGLAALAGFRLRAWSRPNQHNHAMVIMKMAANNMTKMRRECPGTQGGMLKTLVLRSEYFLTFSPSRFISLL